jgi:hypothetical protein
MSLNEARPSFEHPGFGDPPAIRRSTNSRASLCRSTAGFTYLAFMRDAAQPHGTFMGKHAKKSDDWRSTNRDAPWRNRASATPARFGSAKACGTRRDFPWHRGGPVDPTDCPWPRSGAVDCEPGDQAQLWQATLPCHPGEQESLATDAASQALSPGAPQGATLACGTEARAAMVTGADLWRFIAVSSFRRAAC